LKENEIEITNTNHLIYAVARVIKNNSWTLEKSGKYEK
jgi:hypothetical protein